MHYVLVDYENIQPDLFLAIEDPLVDVTIFYGSCQKVNVATADIITVIRDRAECIRITYPGANSLDFHLCFHLGQLVHEHPDGTFEIVSRDKGYDPLVNTLIAKGHSAKRTNGTKWGPPVCKPAQPPSPDDSARSICDRKRKQINKEIRRVGGSIASILAHPELRVSQKLKQKLAAARNELNHVNSPTTKRLAL
jgi:hypothetical protein